MDESKKAEIRKIIETHENALYNAWANFDNINYDIVAESRIKTWTDLEKLFNT